MAQVFKTNNMNETSQKTSLFNHVSNQHELLFGYIDMGDLGLPDIQRPFVWKDKKVRDRFVTKGFKRVKAFDIEAVK